MTVLHYAAFEDHAYIVSYLIGMGAEVDIRNEVSRESICGGRAQLDEITLTKAAGELHETCTCGLLA